MDDDRLTKKVFLWSYRNNSTWYSQVKKKSLYKLDMYMYSYFDFISICDIKEFKSKLFKYYEDVWKLKTNMAVFDGTIRTWNPSSHGQNWSLSQ